MVYKSHPSPNQESEAKGSGSGSRSDSDASELESLLRVEKRQSAAAGRVEG